MSDAALDERALVGTLTALRKLVEEEHGLELDRAASLPPFAFETAEPLAGDARRTYLFRAASQSPQGSAGGAALKAGDGAAPKAGDGAALKAGDGIEVVPPGERGSVAFGTVVAVSPSGVVAELSRQVVAGSIPSPGILRVRVDENQRAIRLRAIERVVRERHTLAWIGAVLTNTDPMPLSEAGWDPPADLGVTEGQRRALAGATRTHDLFLIQGPPGTGKTTVIAALLRHFTEERGLRVLLASKGHRAIDNALERLGAGSLHVLRMGQAGRVTGAGQAVLLADVLIAAEQAVPQRHLISQAAVEDRVRSLVASEQLLAKLDGLEREIVESEAAIAQRVAEIDARFAAELESIRSKELRMAQPAEARQTPAADRALRGFERVIDSGRGLVARLGRSSALRGDPGRARQALYRHAETWVAERRRVQLERGDLLALRDHTAGLHAEQLRLAERARALLPQQADSVLGVTVPPLPTLTPGDTRASLTAVHDARRRAERTLAALRDWGALLEQPGALADVLVETVDVVAATAVGVNSGRDGARMADLEFDVAIVDEASQAQLTDLVVPLSRARTTILVGDHQQLPPYLDDELLRRCAEKGLDTEWLEKSLFEHLWERLPSTHRSRLDMQFRMPAVIADFLSRAFYAGELASVASKRDAGPVCSLFRSPVVFVDTSAEPDRSETAVSPGFVNRCEAAVVADIVARLPGQYQTGEGLGVIAPYSAQVTAVRHALAHGLGLAARDPWLFDNVATVDSFQGQERDVVIVSLTRSNADGAVGFLSDLKRLNVTLSRARQQLVIVGDLSTLWASGGGQDRRAFARFVRDLADHVREHGEVVELCQLRQRLGGD